MSGTRSPATVQYEVWITPAASDAINLAAYDKQITRGRYMQEAIAEAISDSAKRDLGFLLPPPRFTNRKAHWLDDPKPGYKGRWSMWVKVRCTVHNSVPMLLTRAAQRQGFGSGSALVRHYLALAIKEDTGLTVPMPPGRGASNLFGGKVNEEVS